MLANIGVSNVLNTITNERVDSINKCVVDAPGHQQKSDVHQCRNTTTADTKSSAEHTHTLSLSLSQNRQQKNRRTEKQNNRIMPSLSCQTIRPRSTDRHTQTHFSMCLATNLPPLHFGPPNNIFLVLSHTHKHIHTHTISRYVCFPFPPPVSRAPLLSGVSPLYPPPSLFHL